MNNNVMIDPARSRDNELINNELNRLHALILTEHSEWAKKQLEILHGLFQIMTFIPMNSDAGYLGY